MTPPASPPAFSDVYASYAAGCLDPAFVLMVETQSALRPDVRAAVAFSETIAAGFLEAAAPVRLEGDALNRALGAIDALDAPLAPSQRAAAAAGAAMGEILALPEPLRGAAIDAAGRHGWESMGRGLKRLTLATGSTMEVELYRISPGASIPRHSHSGSEFTLVVAGGFSDERGNYGAGDIVVKGPQDVHQPVGDAGEICFALAIRDGGLRFTGMMGFVQRLLGLR